MKDLSLNKMVFIQEILHTQVIKDLNIKSLPLDEQREKIGLELEMSYHWKQSNSKDMRQRDRAIGKLKEKIDDLRDAHKNIVECDMCGTETIKGQAHYCKNDEIVWF